MQKHGQPRVFVVNFEQIRNYENIYIYIYIYIYICKYIYVYVYIYITRGTKMNKKQTFTRHQNTKRMLGTKLKTMKYN